MTSATSLALGGGGEDAVAARARDFDVASASQHAEVEGGIAERHSHAGTGGHALVQSAHGSEETRRRLVGLAIGG